MKEKAERKIIIDFYMKNTFFFIAFLLTNCCFAQNANLAIKPVFGDKLITEDTWLVSKNGDIIQLENVRFYLSAIQFEMADNSTINDTEKAHLIDVFDAQTLTIPFKNIDLKKVKSLRFNLGIDSLTNVSGAMGGDLDPQKGMYWAWQSGYINLKIEGISPKLQTRKNRFLYHLGGYLPPFYAMRMVELLVNKTNFVLKVDVSKFFNNINVTTQKSIMSPSKDALQLADFGVQMFSIE